MSNYKRLPISFARGQGAWLWDTEGRRYLDAISGIAVCGLGHAHPAVREALCEQAGLLLHTSNLYGVVYQQTLAERLTALSGMDNAFFCNSGAEANEAAIKLARLAGHRRGIELPQIVVAEGSFHGRTLATLSATGNYKIQAGFEPLVQGFVRVPYNDLGALERVAQHTPGITALLIEPAQGEGGVNLPASDYLNGARALCDAHNWLLMLDEVQTGIGRTGRWFAYQHNAILPDVLCLAKGLGNGVPIGACLARGEAAGLFQPGAHGSTFGGNPLACRAALAVLDTLEQEALVARAAALGQRLLRGLRQRLGGKPGVVDIRGFGLLLGIELDRPCAELVIRALDKGLLINVTAERVICLLPPLILEDQQADDLTAGLGDLVDDFLTA
jgi:acetylornithine aminotransferase